MEPLTDVLRELQWMTTRLLEDCKTMEESNSSNDNWEVPLLVFTGRCRLCQAAETLNHT